MRVNVLVDFESDIAEVKGKLEAFERCRYDGAAVRARAQAYILSHAPLKSSLADERKHAELSEVVEVVVGARVTDDPVTIREAFRCHYASIFGSPALQGAGDSVAELFRLVPRSDAAESDCVCGPISLSEVCRAIDALPQGKTPRPNEIAAEFYKRYRDVVAPYLSQVFNESYSVG